MFRATGQARAAGANGTAWTAASDAPVGTLARRISVAAGCLMAGALVASASIAVALPVTPMQPVPVVGQSVRAGAAAPTLSVSGPGELDLFG